MVLVKAERTFSWVYSMLLGENVWAAGPSPETIKVTTARRGGVNTAVAAAVQGDISCKWPIDAVDDCEC